MYIKPLKNITKKDVLIAGGKGSSLGEMLAAGFLVPDGCVVLSGAFDHFISTTGLDKEIKKIIGTINTANILSIDEASNKIQTLIKVAEIPDDIAKDIKVQFKIIDAEYVAVRSSATAEDGAELSFAGQLYSYLNVTESILLDRVKGCWASIFTPHAISYCFEKGFDCTNISVAVVVQKMVNSEKSGTAFSVHPVTEDHNQMIIEAGFGLGEAIVSGLITPDSYIVNKDNLNIVEVYVNTQNKALYRSPSQNDKGFNEWQDLAPTKASSQVLDKSDIVKLSEVIRAVEDHWGFPCDIEWAYEDNLFYITQSRPITTLNKVEVM